jgi:chromosome segregation ATPase
LRKKKEQIDGKIKKVEDSILGRPRDAFNQLKDQLKSLEEDCKKEKLVLKNSGSIIERIKRNIEKAEEMIREAHDDLMKASTNTGKLKSALETSIKQKEEYENRLQETITKIQEADVRLEELNSQEAELRKEIEGQGGELRLVERQVTTYHEELTDVEDKVYLCVLYLYNNGYFPDWKIDVVSS